MKITTISVGTAVQLSNFIFWFFMYWCIAKFVIAKNFKNKISTSLIEGHYMFGCILGALFHNRAKLPNYKKEKGKIKTLSSAFSSYTLWVLQFVNIFQKYYSLIKNTIVGTTPKSANSYLEEQAFQIHVSILQSYIKRNCTMNTGKNNVQKI